MLLFIINTTIFSVLCILLVHHLIIFFKDTLTFPKTKNMASIQKQYEYIYNTLQKENTINNSSTNINLLPIINNNVTDNNMKDKLKNFLREQL